MEHLAQADPELYMNIWRSVDDLVDSLIYLTWILMFGIPLGMLKVTIKR